MLTPKEIEARHVMRDATRLAAKGKFRCNICKQVAPQDEGILATYAGNVMVGIHPECVQGGIHILVADGVINVEFERREHNRIVSLSDISQRPITTAKPTVERTEL